MENKGERLDLFKERYRRILAAVVKEYILTAEPVSSKSIAGSYSLGLSPATVRNIMGELESRGFLSKPHTSAGRLPTEKCFRFYLDHLLEPEELQEVDKGFLTRLCENARGENVVSVTKALSSLTGCAGCVLIHSNDNFTIKRIRLLPIDKRRVMVVVVSDRGHIRTRLAEISSPRRFDFERMSNYLNSIGAGLTVGLLKDLIIEEMKKEKNLYDELLRGALKLASAFLQAEPGRPDLYVEGKVNILGQPEFRDNIDRMKRLFAAFEEKSLLVKILDKSLEEEGLHIYLGSESSVEGFEGLSFVTAPYEGKEFSGTLGVIGPVRMNYSRIIPLVSYTAGLLNSIRRDNL